MAGFARITIRQRPTALKAIGNPNAGDLAIRRWQWRSVPAFAPTAALLGGLWLLALAQVAAAAEPAPAKAVPAVRVEITGITA